jgi:hypothetical protein
LSILAAEPKWLAVQAAQAAVPKSLLQLAIHVPVLVQALVLVRPVAVFSATSVLLAAEPKSQELAILVQATTAGSSDQAAASKLLLADQQMSAALQFWMVSKAWSANFMQPTLRRWLASTTLLRTCTLAWLLSTLRRRLLAAVAKPLLLAAALKSLVVAEPVLAAALKSPAVAETVFSATVLPAALKSLLTILAAVLLDATAESEPRSVRAVCSERFSRASQAVMLLLVIRVAAPAEAFLLPLHRSHRLQ